MPSDGKTVLAPQDEIVFRAWATEWGLPMEHIETAPYDYRAAFLANAEPDPSGHWPSDFKTEDHPNIVVGGFHTQTLDRVPGTPRASETELRRLGWSRDSAKELASRPGVPGVGTVPSH